MIIRHRGSGVVPDPFRVDGLDGPPPIGALIDAEYRTLIVVAVGWSLRWHGPLGLLGPKLEAIVTVDTVPEREDA